MLAELFFHNLNKGHTLCEVGEKCMSCHRVEVYKLSFYLSFNVCVRARDLQLYFSIIWRKVPTSSWRDLVFKYFSSVFLAFAKYPFPLRSGGEPRTLGKAARVPGLPGKVLPIAALFIKEHARPGSRHLRYPAPGWKIMQSRFWKLYQLYLGKSNMS